MGLITNNERYNQIVDIWSRVDTRLTETLIRELAEPTNKALTQYL
jgi:DNA-directed RNA polymerase subunit beta'